MRVVMVNGSAHRQGCTYTALSEVGGILKEHYIDYEIVYLGTQPMRDCTACNACVGEGCVFPDNQVNEFLEKAYAADGFVFGSPVYYSHPSGRLLSFMDRVFYSCQKGGVCIPFAGKPAAAVVSARRGGTTASLEAIEKHFSIASMPIVPSTYWNMVHGQGPEDVRQDLEGLQTMRNLGRNLAWMLECGKQAAAQGLKPPVLETTYQTNFIR